MTAEYISCAETAKLVRAALKSRWPRIKFSVRSSVYSGGASIRIGWTDGPRVPDVQKVSSLFEGASFDGMIDLKSHHDTLLSNPDGSVRAVSLGADYVFADRRESDRDTAHAKALEMLHARCGIHDGKWGEEWVENVASNIVRDRDYLAEPDLEAAFKRVALRQHS